MANLKFPNISRSITDQDLSMVFVITAIVMMAIFIVGLDVVRNLQEAKGLDAQRKTLSREKDSWETILKKYPDYRDGYFALAVVEYKLGDKNNAVINLNKSLRLDPNFDDGKTFKSFVEVN